MTTLFTYSKTLTTQGNFNGTYIQSPPMRFPKREGVVHRIRVYHVAISSIIPNVFASTDVGIDTTSYRISGDGGTTWLTVNLIPGFYTINQLNASITDALVANGMLLPANVADPPIYIGINPVDRFPYVVLDTTKGSGITQIGFSVAIGDIWRLFGFLTQKTFVVDGTFGATTMPETDVQGTDIAVLSSFPTTKYIDGHGSNEICRFPIPYYMQNEILFPSYNTQLLSPYMSANIPEMFNGFDVKVVNAANYKPMIFLYGSCNITIEISAKRYY